LTGIAEAVPVDLKSVSIRESNSTIRVDGVLDEEAWLHAEPAQDFFQRYPADTSVALTLTAVKLTYDEDFFLA
jgi:hypothetical protein